MEKLNIGTPELSVVASENSTSNVTNGEVVPVKSAINGEPIAQSSSDAKKIGTVNAKDEIVVNAVQASVTNQQVTQPTSQPQGPMAWASAILKSGRNTQVESRPQSVPGPRGNNRRNSGVTQKLNYDQLRSSLGTFGHIKYLDVIYNKSCAFVEFVEEKSYKECLNCHTLLVSNHCLTFVERRPSRKSGREEKD
ncbi:1081_t:CDS:2 [Scutellospora calospora]|uniref:1081_t:CDS:1 n=1 Tax=Scutellospora calospora TaxID=85575 RepID=A0ACA9LAM2_9GLOM|nr:1081_t:CDS:2 [Scutellospora calospora]